MSTWLGDSPQLFGQTLICALLWRYVVDVIKVPTQLTLHTGDYPNLSAPGSISRKALRVELRISWGERNSAFGQKFHCPFWWSALWFLNLPCQPPQSCEPVLYNIYLKAYLLWLCFSGWSLSDTQAWYFRSSLCFSHLGMLWSSAPQTLICIQVIWRSCKTQILFSKSGVGPEDLHFQQSPSLEVGKLFLVKCQVVNILSRVVSVSTAHFCCCIAKKTIDQV